MQIYARGESRKAVLSWQCNETLESISSATERHFWYVLTGCEPGFTPVLLTSTRTLLTVVLEVPH